MKSSTYKFYSDPGHGWLAVKRIDLVELGILDKITQYSYQKGKTVYLEEDCDASLFMKTMSDKSQTVVVERRNTDRSSPIRSYDRFSIK